MAIMEAEPSAVASGVKSQLASIRAIQHLDANGNPIADPDRSNPTRSRWERPLDTIRAFEAAIDGNYSRKPYRRTESADSIAQNRRSSYYAGAAPDDRQRGPQSGYYAGRPPYRPESSVADGRANGMTRPDSYYNSGDNGAPGAGPSNGYYPNRARYPRTASEPHFNNTSSSVYPVPGQQPSYETVTTASGSGSSADAAGYSTDPSSENSSLDRIHGLPKPPGEDYGFNGFGGAPPYSSPGNGLNYGLGGAERQGNGYQHQGPSPVPRKESYGPVVPMKLGSVTDGPTVYEPPQPGGGSKRKSWFGKRFGKT